mmetsp:Transcript_77602/g.179952  ORF Transcript_77602/g.179952 Transcript_77602/m.179952 type:complete len:402 (+) Transcript_77602:44-1249(+)
MWSGASLALAAGLLVSVAAASPEALPDEVQVLSADDECAAGNSGQACGLSALQFKSFAPGSCVTYGCGGFVRGRLCQCNTLCKKFGNCCSDYQVHCALHASEGSPGNSSEEGSPGTVSEIYTFGAPGTSKPGFVDLARGGRPFEGLRSYTENIFHPGPGKQIDGGAIFGNYQHPEVGTAALHTDGDCYFVPGAGRPDWPIMGAAVYADWGLHKEHYYVNRLNNVRSGGRSLRDVYPFNRARLFVNLAFTAYNSVNKMREIMRSRLPGWRLVAHTVADTLEAKDQLWIAQEGNSLDCALVFTGTSSSNELSSSIKQYETGYCGFPNVHAGYRDKLWWLTKDVWQQLRPKLSKCRKVACVGHSLGGSLCDIFAACANSGRTWDVDYKQQMWTRETPEMLPEVQ